MKRVIKGKLYNTETAERVGMWYNGYCNNDFQYCSEELYQKKTGEFFMHGEGGAMSAYASNHGDMTGYGERIIPMTYDEAAQWAERHLTGEQYEEIFGEVTDGDTVVKTMISTTTAEIEIIKRNASKAGMTVSSYIVMKCTE